jgi:hypothetical protein
MSLRQVAMALATTGEVGEIDGRDVEADLPIDEGRVGEAGDAVCPYARDGFQVVDPVGRSDRRVALAAGGQEALQSACAEWY